MSFVHSILLRAFGRPQGVMGKMGGFIMARTDHKCAVWVIGLLDIKPNDRVLEVSFGPGLGIQFAAGLTSTGYMAGVDPSNEMIAQATARNEDAIKAHVWTCGSAPQGACRSKTTFSTRRWQLIPCKSGQTPLPDCGKCSALQRQGGIIALAFTRYSGHSCWGCNHSSAIYQRISTISIWMGRKVL